MRINLTIIVTLFTLTLFCQNNSCTNFKTGEFKYSNPKYSDWSVSRSDSIQIETNNKTGLEIRSFINWVSDCQYTLTCNEISKAELQNFKGKVFEILIIETDKNSYKCISKKNDIQKEHLVLELIKVK